MNTPTPEHTQRLQRSMAQTMENIVRTNNCIVAAEDKRMRLRMKAKNDSRLAALEQMRKRFPFVQ